mgnify:CR=1 FL=1
MLDPHTAVASCAYEKYVADTKDETKTVIASTASPYKFTRSVMEAIDKEKYGSMSDFDLVDELNKISGGVGGDLLPKEGTLGGRKLADNVMLFDGGRQIALSELSQTGVNSGRVSYARTNWAGQVDLIVLNNGLAGDMIFGRAIVDSKYDPTTGKETDRTITIVCSDTEKYTVYSGNSVSTGAFVAASIKKSVNDRLMFTSFATMSKLSNVSSSAWIGKTAVNFGSRTYEVPSNVQCYNDDTGKWMTLDDAKAYGGTMNLYVYDGVVRIVEVKA